MRTTKTKQIIDILSENPELSEIPIEDLLRHIVMTCGIQSSRQTVINAKNEYNVLKQFVKRPPKFDTETRLERIEYLQSCKASRKKLFVISSRSMQLCASELREINRKGYHIINNNVDIATIINRADVVLPLKDWSFTEHGRELMEAAMKLHKPMLSRVLN
jgi:hypothetical protein